MRNEIQQRFRQRKREHYYPPPKKLNSRSAFLFFILFIFASIFALAPAAFAAGGSFGGGSGSSTDPYIIEDVDDLAAFRDGANSGTYSSSSARLAADIDLSSYDSWTPIGTFKGEFDGGGHAIYNLKVNSSSNYVGFFGYVYSDGVVKNLTIVGGSVSGKEYVGGIAGKNDGTVQNCANSATVSGSSYVGGIVGSNTDTVQNCVNSAAVTGSRNIGIIVGYNIGTVKNCGYLKNADENINSNLNAIGRANGGSGTNLVSFSSEDEMAQIAVNLSASIDKTDLALGSTDTATIKLVPAPGTLEKVYNMGVQNASAPVTDNTNVIKIDNNNDGTFTVKPGSAEGTAEITVTADLYEYSFGSSSYSSTTKTTYTFKFYVSVSDASKPNTDTSTEPNEGASPETDAPVSPETDEPDSGTPTEESETTKTLGSGGGCNAGAGALALLALIPLALRRKR